MWSLEIIRKLNAEAGQRTKGQEPTLVTKESLASMPPFPFPYLGEGCDQWDELWPRKTTLFCDTSGFGSPDEPALTLGQLKSRLDSLAEKGPFWAAFESMGQFQGHLVIWQEGSEGEDHE